MNGAKKIKALWVTLLALPLLLGAIVFLIWGQSETSEGSGELVVFSYSSFMSPWGPGPELAKRFLEREGVAVKYIDSGDSALIVERLRFQSPRDRVDLVLGLDQLVVPEARRVLKWRPLQLQDVSWDDQLPSSYLLEDFAPLDWGPLTFLQKGAPLSVTSFEDLLDPKLRSQIILLDPRTSTPGFQFLYWLVKSMGEDEAFKFLENLRPNVHSVHSSWSTGYSLFQRGEAAMIFTYLTSVFYHWVEQKDQSFQPVPLEAELPVQVEYMGVPEKCVQCESAEKFARFLLEPESQKLIMTKNYMLPVTSGMLEGEEDFQLGPLRLMAENLDQSILSNKRKLLERWKNLGL